MRLKYHRQLSQKRWQKFTFAQQILMIGTELLRAEKRLMVGDDDEARRCYERALELIWLTAMTVDRFHRRRELLRFKEVLLQVYTEGITEAENRQLFHTLILMSGEAWRSLNPIS